MIDQRPTFRPMRVQVVTNSPAEAKYSRSHGAALANHFRPDPAADLIYRGGKVVPQMRYQNIYLGARTSWLAEEKASIDRAIKVAMQDRVLNSVMKEYFPHDKLACDPLDSLSLDEAEDPAILDEPDVEARIVDLYRAKQISHADLDATIFNLILPRGAELRLGESSSREGLGGYHGSTKLVDHGKTITLYYSANVYSIEGNGINAFDKPWKNVVGTLYHELNEFRTDPDVSSDLSTDDPRLGWVSNTGQEIGDQPIRVAKNLRDVFKEILASAEHIPLQLIYSNLVHGPWDPMGTDRRAD